MFDKKIEKRVFICEKKIDAMMLALNETFNQIAEDMTLHCERISKLESLLGSGCCGETEKTCDTKKVGRKLKTKKSK